MNKTLLLALMITGFVTTVLSCRSQRTPENVGSVNIDLRVVCQLPQVLVESSGVALEGNNRIWSHEDSGNPNELYCIDSTGTVIRTLEIANAINTDWEDLATDNEETWFVADAGNNNNNRTDLTIYRIPAPETVNGSEVTAGIIRFSLSDQTAFPPPATQRNFDIEAMIWVDDSLFLFTKDRSNPFTGITKMYALPDVPGEYVARLAGSCFIGADEESGRVTSADINLHTGELVLLTHKGIVSFTDYPNHRFFEGTRTDYAFTALPGQNEGIAFVSTGKLYMTEEGNGNNPGNLYEIRLPQSQLSSGGQHTGNLVQVFPNPFSDLIKVRQPSSSLIELIDNSGRILHSAISGGETSINTDKLQPGLYFLRSESTEGVAIHKVIKN